MESAGLKVWRSPECKKPTPGDGLSARTKTNSFGSPTWARTRDLRINSPALYRLSYRGTEARILVAKGGSVKRMQAILTKNQSPPMDQNLVYAKTPIGDEAVRQSTRVVQRNLRMLLVQVDGKLTIAELGTKLGDPKMVERSLRELEEGGFIAPILEAVSVWQESKLRVDRLKAAVVSGASTLGSKSLTQIDSDGASSNFSSFGKPVLSANGRQVAEKAQASEESAAKPGRSRLIWVLIGLVTSVLVAVSVVLFFPYTRFKPDIEAELARVWQLPVSVGDVRLNILPQPFLLLSNVRIGDGSESRIEKIRVFEPYSMLGSGVHSLTRVEVSGGRIATDHLMALATPGDGAQLRNKPKTIVKTVAFDGLSIAAGQLVFGELVGEASFGNDGRIENASLRTVDRTLRIEAQATQEGALLAIEGVGWRPTDESALTLESVQAKGLLNKDKLVVQSFDMHALGGVLRGSWLLDWSNGLVMAGDATLERLDSRKVMVHFAPAVALEGELMGILRLRGAGKTWQSLWLNADASLDAFVLRGAFNGIDIGEAARRGPGAPVRAGTTRFDRLAVKISIDPRQVVGRDLSMNAELFAATGQFVVTRDRQVDSNLAVTMQGSAAVRTTPIKISGTLPNLQAVSVR